MTRPFSLAYKQKMLDRLTGKDAVSARQLSLETGLRQQTLSRWLQDACSLSVMPSKRQTREWSIDEKIRIQPARGLSMYLRAAIRGVVRATTPRDNFEVSTTGRPVFHHSTVILRPVTSPTTCASVLPTASNWSIVKVPR